MNKSLLIKYICNQTSPTEERQVLQWIAKSAENKRYYANLKNLIVSRTLPGQQADSTELDAVHWAIYMNEKAKRVKSRKLFIISSAVASVAIILLAYIILVPSAQQGVQTQQSGRVLLAQLPHSSVNTLYTENGIKGKVLLPDSSTVILNSASSITYPAKFSGSTREISFSGEGYFTVKADSLSPMVIKTDKDIDIVVYGTEFNLNTFNDKVETTLYSGKIKVVSGSKEECNLKVTEMKPLTKMFASASSAPITVSLTNEIDTRTKAWTKGELIFDSTPLHQVIAELKRWHGVEIVVEDPSILNYKITGRFKAESAVQIANFIKYCALVDYRFSNNTLYLRAR